MANVSSRIFDLGKSALLAHQQGINTAGHNIANAETPGYSRQRINLETNRPTITAVGSVGTGVRADGITRVHDRLLAGQIRGESAALGTAEARQGLISRAESVLNPVGGADIGTALSEFWNGWQAVADNPASQTEREVLLTRARVLGDRFRNATEGLSDLVGEAESRIRAGADQVNALSREIAALNEEISAAETTGVDANDLRDRRDLRLREISSWVAVRAVEDGAGRVSVSSAGGASLVTGVRAETVTAADLRTGSGEGKIRGWVQAAETLNGYIDTVRTVATAVRDGVNSRHTLGFDRNGDAAGPFFDPAADGLEVAIGDPARVSAAATSAGVPGDNSNALAIADLRNDPSMDGATPGETVAGLVTRVGIDAETSQSTLDFQEGLVNDLDAYRQSISGVSLDEETISLIQFQNAYEASARLISVVDEMLDTVMGLVR
jgi:flagellar hook-associated protein 1 FlgK